MGTNWPKPGINHVGEYQVSGHTLAVTGSGNTIFLKYVACMSQFLVVNYLGKIMFRLFGSQNWSQFVLPKLQ